MLIFSYGMPKSASTYAFQLSQLLLQRAGLHVVGPLQILQDGPYEWFLPEDTDLDDFAARALGHIAENPNTVCLVKTHKRCTEGVQRLINEDKVKATATFRHPQELALSLMDATTVERRKGWNRFDVAGMQDAIAAITSGIDRVKSWLAAPGTFPLLYDQLVSEPSHIVGRLAEYFGVEGDPDAVVSYFEEDKQGRIWEFNKGQLNRHLSEFPGEHLAEFAERFGAFQEDVDNKKRDVGMFVERHATEGLEQ